MTDEHPGLDAAYNAGSTIDTTGRAGFDGGYVADYIVCELPLAALNEEPMWKCAKERQYLNLVLVCECGKRHRLRFGPDEQNVPPKPVEEAAPAA